MGFIKNFFYKIYTVWVMIVFTLFLIILFPFFVIPLMINQRFGFITCRFLHLWAYIFSKLTLIRYHIYGRENVKKSQSYIFVCNHTSYLDSPGIALTIPYQWRPLGKKELTKIPVFGYMLKQLAVIVDRSNAESRKKSLRHMIRILKKKISILIFPEGTMNRTNKVLQPFYDGAFRIAIQTQTPILPMVVLNAGKLMPPNKMTVKPGIIEVHAGEPIPTEGLTLKDVPILKNKTYEKMLELVSKYPTT